MFAPSGITPTAQPHTISQTWKQDIAHALDGLRKKSEGRFAKPGRARLPAVPMLTENDLTARLEVVPFPFITN
jgi:hypothetical protein